MEAPQKRVLVPIAFGSEEIEVVTVIDVFCLGGALVTVASVEKDLQIECLNGVKLVADTFISDCESQVFDLVVLLGGMPGLERLRNCKVLRKITDAHAKEGRLYGALSEAPAVVLETWGLLKGCQGPRGWNRCEVVKEEYNVDDWSLQNIPRVLVPIANRSDEMEAVVVVDVLRRAKANVVVASVEDSLEIVAARGTKIVADRLFKDAISSNYDLIHLPGGSFGAQKFGSSEQLIELLREHAESNKVYGAICASAVMLDTKRLLKGKKATTHPHYSNKLSDQSSVNVRVVIDGKVITTMGPGSTMEYALNIVEKFFGIERAKAIAKAMVFSYP